jgi:hypothetical protein
MTNILIVLQPAVYYYGYAPLFFRYCQLPGRFSDYFFTCLVHEIKQGSKLVPPDYLKAIVESLTQAI